MGIRNFKGWLLFAAAFLPSWHLQAAEPSEKQRVRVLVVIQGTRDSLQAYYFSKTAGQVGSIFGLVGAVAASGHAVKKGPRLNGVVGEFDRGALLERAFEQAVAAKYPMLDIDARVDSVPTGSDTKALLKQAEADGFRYLILFEDVFSGVHTIDAIARDDTVAVLLQGKFQLFDLKDGKSMLKLPVMSFSAEREAMESAVENRAFFTGHYPAVADRLVVGVFSELYRVDMLHAMAESVGRGDEVPALSSLLAKYAPPVKISVEAPRKWKMGGLKTAYARSVEPSSDLRARLGVIFEVDLLLPELGVKVGSIDEYMAIVAGRLSNAGFDPNTIAPYEGVIQPGLEGYSAYVIRRQVGDGGNILFVKRLDDTYMALISVVTTDKLDWLTEQHKAAIEAAIRGGTISIQSAAN